MTLYCTLSDAKTENKATGTTDDNYLLGAIRIVSRRIDREFAARRPLFAPTIETRKIRVSPERVNSYDGTFRLDGPLLSASAVSIGTTALTVGTNVEGYPNVDMPPYPYLRITNCDAYNWYYNDCADCSGPLMVTVSGTWGVHLDYANAWHKVDDLADDIASSATTLTVADIDGADLYGITPRISAGSLLKIGTEFLEVTATVVGTNTAGVRRGVNGSTAAAHSTGDDVYVWQVEEPIRRVTARQAGLMYARRGAFTTVEITGISEVRYPVDLLTELKAVLQDYVYVV